MGLLSLLLVSFFSACEHIGSINSQSETNTIAEANSYNDDKVQVELKKDAMLARKMPLKQFARHMKKRHAYYKQFNATYKDDFVMIYVDREKMRIETPKGKVKFEYSEEG